MSNMFEGWSIGCGRICTETPIQNANGDRVAAFESSADAERFLAMVKVCGEMKRALALASVTLGVVVSLSDSGPMREDADTAASVCDAALAAAESIEEK